MKRSGYDGITFKRRVDWPRTYWIWRLKWAEWWHRKLTNSHRIGDWDIYWTGWKRCNSQFDYCGQWIATNRQTKRNIYSSYPGILDYFLSGSEFNTALQDDQIDLTSRTPKKVLKFCKADAYKRLLKAIKW